MHERSRARATARDGPRAVGSSGRRETARSGEEIAAAHLTRRGFRVLARNARTREGEIDIVAFDGATLVFAEVKTLRVRAAAGAGEDPLSGLRARQRARVRRLAVAWLAAPGRARPYAREIRFDAIGVLLDTRGELVRLDHLEGAW